LAVVVNFFLFNHIFYYGLGALGRYWKTSSIAATVATVAREFQASTSTSNGTA
jgi:hypothetical protein